MSFRDIHEQVAAWDAMIRAGQGGSVQAQLNEWIAANPNTPRSACNDVANIARRVGKFNMALTIMRPIVRPRVPIHPAATHQELATYAGVLAKIGAVEEALNILNKLDENETPEVCFHKTTAHFTRWEYASAIPLLKRYMRHPAVNAYTKLVASVNLAAAYVFTTKYDEASQLLSDIRLRTSKEGHQLLYANALELTAQLEISSAHFVAAQDALYLARQNLQKHSGLSEFFLRKWQAILNLRRHTSPSTEAIDEINGIRREAVKKRHWETVREVDLQLALANKDVSLFNNVYFGTPFSAYRRKMQSQLTFSWSKPKTHLWDLSTHTEPQPALASTALSNCQTLDVAKAITSDNKKILEVGTLPHQALQLLSGDFYRPIDTVTLFAELFAGEYFNPESSFNRIHQLIHRLRRMLHEADTPLLILAKRGEFRLSTREPYLLKVQHTQKRQSPQDARLEELKSQWPYQVFAASDAAAKLNCSARTASRLLTWAVGNRGLVRVGQGAGTFYRWK